MSHPLNTPLGRFGIVTSEEGPQRCVASIPAGGMINPLTGVPTVAALAMLVDHIGGLVNHHRRGPGELTVSSDLSLELAPNALAQLGSAAVNENRDDRPLNTASLRVNFLRQFRSGPESRYVGTPLRVGRSSGVAESRAIGDDGEVAIIARLTAYR
jgi:acyl-coenzyme A thioesterase PaaI-like protein